MATVGQQLTAPESGWRRYDDFDSRIQYIGNWITASNSAYYSSSSHYITNSTNGVINFKFYGSKLRIISPLYPTYSNRISIKIDNVTEEFSVVESSTILQGLVYEKTELINDVHNVTITKITNGTYISDFWLDAIDIDDTGYLVHPILNQVSDINVMQVGDCITCRYTANTSGQPGYFSELGTCIADEISVTGTTTPNGLFYFIKTNKGTLIADRVIQTNISWDTLNAAKFIEGNKVIIDLTNQSLLIDNGHAGNRSYIFDNVFNKGYISGWESSSLATTNPHSGWWVGANFNVPTTIDSFSITATSDYPTEAPYDFIFQGSNDGTHWINIQSYNGVTFTSSQTRKFYIDKVTYSQYRILVTATNYPLGTGNYLCIAQMEIGPSYIIRSLLGGCAYADSNGNKSLTNQNNGGWPINNEWDKYIVNSDLNGKVTKGDNNIWHWNLWSWVKETPTIGFLLLSGGATNNTFRIARGYEDGTHMSSRIDGLPSSTSTITNGGFRPVLNYVESDIANEVIY